MMETIAFRMQLHPGFEKEYEKRHDAIWPDLKVLLKEAGIRDYSIFHDPTTNALFGILKTDALAGFNELAKKETMRKWWEYMADIMETNPDGSPISIRLDQVFFMP
jgi:L-rhamnose mutarotase